MINRPLLWLLTTGVCAETPLGIKIGDLILIWKLVGEDLQFFWRGKWYGQKNKVAQ